ncbi:hypothetical protein TCAL_12914 [Tigriopus californicus]|uniref:Tudor domain-containing protein n=2 Tax=Tigriopus californicus TaxID=6832 RepID=A0A553PLE0_TIGCA|nr:hypothetical protein TCAL_12914 [Tigriopus californicus]
MKPHAKFWYRAQIHSLIHSSRGMLVRVFFLDYGELSEPVSDTTCIRSLPQRFKVLPPPMAIQVVLPGLRPLSLDIDHAMGMGTMSQVFADSWSSAAVDTVRTLISQTNHRWAILSNWQKDRAGRYLADVQLRGHPFKVHLHRVLIDGGFAFFDQKCYREQLQGHCDISLDRLVSNLSICGPDPSVGNSSLNDISYVFEDEEEMDSEETAVHESDICQVDLFNWEVMPPITRKKKVELLPKIEEESTNGKLLQRIRNTKMGRIKVEEKQVSIWDQFKTPSHETRDESRNYLVIPAGMDPGKFLEEQLARITDHDGIGPKMLDPKLVCVKGSN